MNLSGIRLNSSNLEKQNKILSNSTWLYLFVAIELIVALVWSSFCIYFWNALGSKIVDLWWVGIIVAVVCVVLILAAHFVNALKVFPVNLAIYVLFTLSFAHLWAFLCCWDSTRIVYFGLWVLTMVLIGISVYQMTQSDLPTAMESFFISFGIGCLVLVAFIIFSNGKFFLHFLAFLLSCIFAFFMSFGLRALVKGQMGMDHEDDALSGAVRIWLEAKLVFYRSGELLGHSILGTKQCC